MRLYACIEWTDPDHGPQAETVWLEARPMVDDSLLVSFALPLDPMVDTTKEFDVPYATRLLRVVHVRHLLAAPDSHTLRIKAQVCGDVFGGPEPSVPA